MTFSNHAGQVEIGWRRVNPIKLSSTIITGMPSAMHYYTTLQRYCGVAGKPVLLRVEAWCSNKLITPWGSKDSPVIAMVRVSWNWQMFFFSIGLYQVCQEQVLLGIWQNYYVSSRSQAKKDLLKFWTFKTEVSFQTKKNIFLEVSRFSHFIQLFPFEVCCPLPCW